MLSWFGKKKKKVTTSSAGRTLCDVNTGEEFEIECLRGDADECQRLREMGFCENAKVEKVAQNQALICRVCDSKVIISQGLAKNILVNQHDKRSGGEMPSSEKVVLLSELSAGQEARIHDFIEENDTCARLEEMGVTPGESVEIIRYAPMGDPVEIKIRGYSLSLRKEEADLIQVRI